MSPATTVTALAVAAVVGLLVVAATGCSGVDRWSWSASEVSAFVEQEIDASSVRCARKQAGAEVRRWRCAVRERSGRSGVIVVLVHRDSGISSFAHGVRGVAVEP